MGDQVQPKFATEIYHAVMFPANPFPAQFAIQVRILSETVGEDPTANSVARLQDRYLPSSFLQHVPSGQSRKPGPDNHATFFFNHPSSHGRFAMADSSPLQGNRVGSRVLLKGLARNIKLRYSPPEN